MATTTPTNGATKTAATVKPAQANVVLLPPTAPKVEEKNPEEKKDSKPEILPLEDRILKVQQLSDLIERREKLQETIKKLQSFKLSSDGSRDRLSITDSRGNEFTTSNSSAIADVVNTLKISLQAKLVETEALIRF